MATQEDTRVAAGLAASLSGQIAGASLAMVSVLGAILIFVMDRRQPTTLGLVMVAAAFLLFVISIGCGAKAVASIYRKGHGGEWSFQAGDGAFQLQAVSAIVGLLLFPLGVAFMGPPAADAEAARARNSIDSLRVRVSHLDSGTAVLRRQIDSLRAPHSPARLPKPPND